MDTNNLAHQVKKFLGPAALLLVGLILLFVGFDSEVVNEDEVLEQTGLFKIGGSVIFALGIVNLLYVLDIIGAKLSLVFLALFILAGGWMFRNNYLSIYGEKGNPSVHTVLWFEERDFRHGHIIQRLEDIRSAQLAYRDKYRRFCSTFDSLVDFVKNENLMIIKQNGSNPGTVMSRGQADELGYPADHELDYLTNEEAIALGYIVVDTLQIPVLEAVFSNEEAMADRSFDIRGNFIKFYPDSLAYVPFAKDGDGNPCLFNMETGMVESGRQQSPVIYINDPCPYDPDFMLELGSTEQVSTSGNWGE